jgi:hypothetical protein
MGNVWIARVALEAAQVQEHYETSRQDPLQEDDGGSSGLK